MTVARGAGRLPPRSRVQISLPSGHYALVTEAQFSIGLSDDESPFGVAIGRLVLGEMEEAFESSLGFWRPDDYRRHWRDAVARTLSGAERSALVTSMENPTTANFIRWWPMYRTGDTVHFQEQILFLAETDEPFRLDEPFASVRRRTTISDDGDKVSEWSVPIGALASWASKQ